MSTSIWDPATPIVLASGNPHKLEEMNALLAGRLRFISLTEAAASRGVQITEPAEPGRTFEANAEIKAVSYARQLGMACLADDSGLEIDALDGRPGVISSHYCTDGQETGMTRAQRDTANNQRVLTELADITPAQRTARFVCVLCLAAMDATGQERAILSVRGTFEGRIGLPGTDGAIPRGNNGFGYDPLFLVGPAFTQTSAELSPQAKNRLSHRAAAVEQLVDRLGVRA